MSVAAWRGRRVLITGHTGFKGGWLALWLQELGARLAGFSLAPQTEPSLYTAAGLRDALEREALGDLRDADALARFVRDFDPEVIFHLAAQSLVRRSYADPRETFATNVVGTSHLLEAARLSPGLRAVVVVTSDKCYRNDGAQAAFREDDPLGGADPYAASKACAEIMAEGYRNAFFSGGSCAALASARAGNVIGGGDWAPDRLVVDAVHAFMAAKPVRLRHPEATRPWQHVLDALNGYLQLAEAMLESGAQHSGAWNFGPARAEERSVSWLVERLAACWGSETGWELDPGPHPREAAELRLDSSKARAQLRWRPRLELEQAVTWTADWYRGHLQAPATAQRLCLDQIRRFGELAAA